MLQKRPLVTKILTGAVLSSVSELLSQWLTMKASDKENKIKWIKIAVMFLYGGTINAPINHFSYKWINELTSQKVVPKWRNLVQLFCSWFIVSPVQVLGLLLVLTSINSEKRISIEKLRRVLKNRYLKMLSSSLITSTVLVSVAQRYIATEKWSVFFSVAYACLGTGQNVYLKFYK